MYTIGGIQGITLTGTTPPEAPTIVVIGPEKIGKSTTAISLLDWPRPGGMPLIVAFDSSGPDSCAQLGYQMHVLKVKNVAGNSLAERAYRAAQQVADAFKQNARDPNFPYTSIVVDCASTLVDDLVLEAKPKYRDGRQVYGEVKDAAERFYGVITKIGVPVIFYAWLSPAFVDAKGKLQEGTAKITGSFKTTLCGKATNIIMLDREKHGQGAPGADHLGYVRMFRTQTYNSIGLGGRYALPDPMPAHLGMVLTTIMGGIPTTQQAASIPEGIPTQQQQVQMQQP